MLHRGAERGHGREATDSNFDVTTFVASNAWTTNADLEQEAAYMEAMEENNVARGGLFKLTLSKGPNRERTKGPNLASTDHAHHSVANVGKRHRAQPTTWPEREGGCNTLGIVSLDAGGV